MRSVATVLGVLVLAAVAAMAVLWLLQRRLMYFPAPAVPPLEQLGLEGAEALEFTTADGLRLEAWYVAPPGVPRGAVLVLPGNGGNRAGRVPLAEVLRDCGLAVLLVDYRGYGGNPGAPTQEGLLADARAAADALSRRSGTDDDRLVYFGESLGSAVAAGLAAERPPGALILRSPFPGMTQMARREFPWLPVTVLLRDRYPTSGWLASYSGPTLVVAGEDDTLVPPEFSQQVARAAAGPTEFVTVPGAGHNDPELLDGRRMIRAIRTFLGEHSAIDLR